MPNPDFIATAGGHRLFVRDWGAGPPVLFLAGWAMSSDLWRQVMVLLNHRGLRALAYDRRGHGRSSDPGVVDYSRLADDLACVLEARELNDCTIVAHSGAAGEVIRYVTRHGSARLKRLIFVGPQGPCLLAREDNPEGIPRHAFEGVVTRLKEDLPRWLSENIEAFVPGEPPLVAQWAADMVLGCSPRIAVDLQRVIAEADFREEVQSLNLPLTIIHGDKDASCPIDLTGRRYAALAPGAEFVLYAGAAHGLMITHAARLAEDIAAVAAAT